LNDFSHYSNNNNNTNNNNNCIFNGSPKLAMTSLTLEGEARRMEVIMTANQVDVTADNEYIFICHG
jgi:hypothetical protein